FLALASVMLLTRFHHFGDSLHLPDASWAVFFAGGLWLKQWRLFLLFCGLATGIDAAAIHSGTSSFCVTPAYGFLLPAYAVLWFAGQKSAFVSAAEKLLFCAAASVLTFAISSYSFHFFSGYFSRLSFLDYAISTGHYLLQYEIIAVSYTGVFLLLNALVSKALAGTTATQSA
ncbi:MAG TPA: hypothetical protein VFM46_10430, partial [Pseudomonadales bacterium]|nr:hypothetical protein [Pseudomonadales bacterium]